MRSRRGCQHSSNFIADDAADPSLARCETAGSRHRNTRRQGFRHPRLDKSLQRDARVLDPDLNTLTSATLHRSAISSALIPCCLKFCVVIYSYPLVHHLRPPPQVCHHHCLLVTHAREHRNDRIKCIMIFRIEYKSFKKNHCEIRSV